MINTDSLIIIRSKKNNVVRRGKGSRLILVP